MQENLPDRPSFTNQFPEHAQEKAWQFAAQAGRQNYIHDTFFQ